jgi:hypothetical protein
MRLSILVIARSDSDEAIQSGGSAWITSRHFVSLAMTRRSRDALSILVIARSVSDEAIQSGGSAWIASRHFVSLAMTRRSRGAPLRPSFENGRMVSSEWRMDSIRTSQFAIRNSQRHETRSKDKAQVAVPAFPSPQAKKKYRKRNADRRNGRSPCLTGTAAPASAGAHLSAFHHGSCLGDRTPPLSFSPRYLGWGP